MRPGTLPIERLRCEPLELHLRHTFTIARASEDIATTVIARLRAGDLEGVGESAPVDRYGESAALVIEQLERSDLAGIDAYALDAALARIGDDRRGALCALDLALHDLIGKALGVPVYRLLGLDPGEAKPTSFTIGIADLPTMLGKAREALHYPILKVKVGSGGEIEMLEALRGIYRGVIRVDANEAWEPEEAVRMLVALRRFDIEFCEQPIAAGDPARFRYVKERSPIPVYADESCRTLDDVAPLGGCADGIVIKLVKCGGIRAAVAMIHAARALGLRVMIGCMIESSVLATAGAHLTPLVDHADLDGPLLVTDDPFDGVTFDGASLRLPERPGLGVVPRAGAAAARRT